MERLTEKRKHKWGVLRNHESEWQSVRDKGLFKRKTQLHLITLWPIEKTGEGGGVINQVEHFWWGCGSVEMLRMVVPGKTLLTRQSIVWIEGWGWLKIAKCEGKKSGCRATSSPAEQPAHARLVLDFKPFPDVIFLLHPSLMSLLSSSNDSSF